IHGSKNSIKVKIKDSYTRPEQITPARDLSGVRELHPQTPGALRTTHEAAGATGSHESTAAAGVPAAQYRLNQLHLRRCRLRRLHPNRHRHRRLHLHRCHRSPTSATTPTPAPSSASSATTSSPATSSSALAPLALAVAAPLTRSRRSADRLGANKVDSSSRGNGGQKRNGGAPLKERGTGVTTRGSYSVNTSLCCKEALLEEVNAGVTSAEVRNEVSDCGKSGEVREQTVGDYAQQGGQQHRVWSTASEQYCQHQQQGQ
ncbi:unnamed protein product, partial [Closterium sp. NIES-54]